MFRSTMSCAAVSLLALCVFNVSVAERSWAQQSEAEAGQPATPAAATQPAAAAQAAGETRKPATPAAPADPTGSWKWDFTTPDENKLEFSLKLKWDGKKLEGNYTSFGNTVKIEEAKLEKDGLSFVVRPEFQGSQMEVAFDGKVAKDEIRGTIGLDFGDQPREIEWIAKRFVDVDDVVGTWQLRLEMPGGNVAEPTLKVTKGERGLLAKYTSEFLGEIEAKNVQIKENKLTFELAIESDEFAFSSTYSGTPRGNTMEGAAEFDVGGGAGVMAFTGKRLPPKEEKKEEAAARPGDDQQQRAGAGRPAGENADAGDQENKVPQETTPATAKPDDQ